MNRDNLYSAAVFDLDAGQVTMTLRNAGKRFMWMQVIDELNVTPCQNEGKTVYRLTFKDVPVDAIWSISVYNAEGYFQENKENAYTLNNLTARKGEVGSVTIPFGSCDGKTLNCLPTMQGWNYIVRLYRPRAEVLDGSWTFPQALPLR
jgi:hypothetical protein